MLFRSQLLLPLPTTVGCANGTQDVRHLQTTYGSGNVTPVRKEATSHACTHRHTKSQPTSLRRALCWPSVIMSKPGSMALAFSVTSLTPLSYSPAMDNMVEPSPLLPLSSQGQLHISRVWRNSACTILPLSMHPLPPWRFSPCYPGSSSPAR